MLDVAIIGVTVLVGALLLRPSIMRERHWRAVVTPLASIIGSGFLVLGPIMQVSFGWAAPLAMAVLCALAWGLGASIRHNIAVLDRHGGGWPGRAERRLEALAAWALAFAYVVSVAYYLNLFGAFAARIAGPPEATGDLGRWITTAALLLVLSVGWLRGFSGLERVEQLAVSIKLAIIAGLLLGLAVYMGEALDTGRLWAPPPQESGWQAATLLLGLLITVQGFETTRYLGAEYPAALRILAMRRAQLLASAIYVTYAALIAYSFAPGEIPLSETGVIDLVRHVARSLPPLLIAGALAAQLSAAVADTVGAGGLFAEASGGRIPTRAAYAFLTLLGLVMTWGLDVFVIVAWASRAFAAYYALQSLQACISAWREGARAGAAAHGAMALLALAAVLFGRAVEGSG